MPECTIKFSKKKKKKNYIDILACRGLFKYNLISQEKEKEKISKIKESMLSETYFWYLKISLLFDIWYYILYLI